MLTPASLTWRNGAPVSSRFGDVYFSAEGGMAETDYVFLQGNRLAQRVAKTQDFTIVETGFGTGLNLLMAWDCWNRHAPAQARLHYLSYEKHPLARDDLARALAAFPALAPLAAELLRAYPPALPGYHRFVLSPPEARQSNITPPEARQSNLSKRVFVTLVFGDVNDHAPELDTPVDAWFLDGFAPAKNPDMWGAPLFDAMRRCTAEGGTAATFTAAAAVREGLSSAGFAVEKIKGFGHKRHMLRADVAAPPASAALRRGKPASVMILGAGLAGCSTAYSLAQRGIPSTLVEQYPAAASGGASANPLAARTPYFTVDRSPRGQCYSSAYTYSLTLTRQLKTAYPQLAHGDCGVLALDLTERQQQKHGKLATALPADVARAITAEEASGIAGIPLTRGGLYYPNGGWTRMRSLAHAMLTEINAHILTRRRVERLLHKNGLWQALDGMDRIIATAECLVLTNGYDAARLLGDETIANALEPVRGQLTLATPTPATAPLAAVLNYGGYLTPAVEGTHIVGSTFQRHDTGTELRHEDHAETLNTLASSIPALAGALRPTGGWAATRCASRDRMPLIGELAPGLYLNLAHGSRGIHSCPFGGELLAGGIAGGPPPLESQAQRALDPKRFIMKMNRLR